MKFVSLQLQEYPIEPSFRMCTDCVLFSEDYCNVYAADAALIDTGATRTSVSMDIKRLKRGEAPNGSLPLFALMFPFFYSSRSAVTIFFRQIFHAGSATPRLTTTRRSRKTMKETMRK